MTGEAVERRLLRENEKAPTEDRFLRVNVLLAGIVACLGGLLMISLGAGWLLSVSEADWLARAGAVLMGVVLIVLGASLFYMVTQPGDGELPEDMRLGPFWRCPSCGAKRMVFITPYARYFCQECRRYAPRDYRPSDDFATGG